MGGVDGFRLPAKLVSFSAELVSVAALGNAVRKSREYQECEYKIVQCEAHSCQSEDERKSAPLRVMAHKDVVKGKVCDILPKSGLFAPQS